LFAPLTAQAADNFAQTYTWNSSTPPTLPTPATGAYGNGHFLINLSGTPSGTFYAAAYSVTFRGTVTNSNASLTISGSSGTAINWEADWSGTSNAQFGAVVVTTTAFDDPPSFVVTGSIVNAGTAPALYAANVPVI
jgi:hypothetical protein